MNRRPLPCVVRNLRPIPPTIELMPGVTLYDHEADPDDVPVLPDLVARPCRCCCARSTCPAPSPGRTRVRRLRSCVVTSVSAPTTHPCTATRGR